MLFHLEINLGIIEVFTVAITEERFTVYGPNPARHGIAVMYEFRGFLVGGACAVFRNKRQSLSQINIFNKAKIKEPVINQRIGSGAKSAAVIACIADCKKSVIRRGKRPFKSIAVFIGNIYFKIYLNRL